MPTLPATPHLEDRLARLRGQLTRSVSEWDLTPTRITALYVLVALLFLLTTDAFIARFVNDPVLAGWIGTAKGVIEIVITGGLIFVLTRHAQSRLEAQNHRLETRRTELQVLHRVLRHNLRNDLNLITGHATSLRAAADDPEQVASCETILETADEILHYTDQAQKIRQATEDESRIHVRLPDRLAEVVDDHPRIPREATVTISCPESITVEANPMLGRAIAELLTNAIEHAGDDPDIEISVERSVEGDDAEIAVIDDGPGFPYRVRNVLDQQREDQLRHLSGMGLWFVHWTVSLSDGTFSVENHENGAIARIRVPIAAD